MDKNILINTHCSIFNICFCFLLINTFIFGFNYAYAELVLVEDAYKVVVNNSDKRVNDSSLRDPTQPLHTSKKTSAVSISLVLQAIFTRSNQRSAIINGQYVSVGDVVSYHKVIAISTKTVDLESKDKKITLNLRDDMRNAGS